MSANSTSRSDALIAALALSVAACQSNPAADQQIDDSAPAKPIGQLVEATNTPVPIGKLLADLDASIRAWTNLMMSAQSEGDRRRASLLEQNLMFVTHKRRDDLIAELESGAPNNRMVAASALGFTRDVEVQSPLLAALEDPNAEVVGNALLGLALLGREDTPLDRICYHLQTHALGSVRSNAALCMANLVQAGARSECVLPTARLGLLDAEPGVRSQSALALATLVDATSLNAIGERIYDPVPLVGAACARAVAYIGRQSSTNKGAAARMLAQAYDTTKGPVRAQVLRSLVELAEANLGTEAKEWREWAGRLP